MLQRTFSSVVPSVLGRPGWGRLAVAPVLGSPRRPFAAATDPDRLMRDGTNTVEAMVNHGRKAAGSEPSKENKLDSETQEHSWVRPDEPWGTESNARTYQERRAMDADDSDAGDLGAYRPAGRPFGSDTRSVVSEAKETVQDAARGLRDRAEEAKENIETRASQAAEATRQAAGTAAEKARETAEVAAERGESVLSSVAHTVAGAASAVEHKAEQALHTVVGAVKNATEAVKKRMP